MQLLRRLRARVREDGPAPRRRPARGASFASRRSSRCCCSPATRPARGSPRSSCCYAPPASRCGAARRSGRSLLAIGGVRRAAAARAPDRRQPLRAVLRAAVRALLGRRAREGRRLVVAAVAAWALSLVGWRSTATRTRSADYTFAPLVTAAGPDPARALHPPARASSTSALRVKAEPLRRERDAQAERRPPTERTRIAGRAARRGRARDERDGRAGRRRAPARRDGPRPRARRVRGGRADRAARR